MVSSCHCDHVNFLLAKSSGFRKTGAMAKTLKRKKKKNPISGADAERAIRAFGGLSDFSKAVGIPVSTIFSWRQGGIPHWRLGSIIKAAQQNNVALPDVFEKAA